MRYIGKADKGHGVGKGVRQVRYIGKAVKGTWGG